MVLKSKYSSAREASKHIQRLPNNLNISFNGIPSLELIKNIKTIAVSSGAACSSNKQEASHVLQAIQLSDLLIHSSIRFGIGHQNTIEEIEETINKFGLTLEKYI